MIVSIVAAVAENGIIGRGDGLPWRLPADMRHFKQLTIGHAVVMGRKTFDTLPQPLSDRRNVVVTRDQSYQPTGADVVHSIEAALQLVSGEEEVFIAGGGEVYKLALPYADRLYLTVVHAECDGDTRFPDLNVDEWKLVESVRHEADERHATSYSFTLYERVVERPARPW
ncbi:MAG: dihydrofolate reductase [Gemmatimonadales bacterium]